MKYLLRSTRAVLLSAPMWRAAAGIVLALSVALLVYRVALASQPREDRVVTIYHPGRYDDRGYWEFDPVTGLPYGPLNTYLYPDGWSAAGDQWTSSAATGIISGTVVLAVAWWFGHRRRPIERL